MKVTVESYSQRKKFSMFNLKKSVKKNPNLLTYEGAQQVQRKGRLVWLKCKIKIIV